MPKTNGGRGRGANSNGQSVYGIKKLRELILELAVRGKLVPQDSNDLPASILLEKIAKEKARLIKEGNIKKQKPLPEISEDEKPFALPVGWGWSRLGDLGDWGAGSTPERKNPAYYGGDMNWFKSGELKYNEHLTSSEETVTSEALERCSLRICHPGDVLIAMYGATIGMLAILENDATTNQAVCACTCHTGLFNRFLFLILRAWGPRFNEQGAGGAQPNISKVKIINTITPLPPLAEQHRIVAKVDELMALCDQLEQQQIESSDTHQTLVKTLLATLTNAADQKECAKAWQRIANHFDTLFTTEQSIDQLKQTILQLAVMGKLVPQDPNDLPAPQPGKWLEGEIKAGRTRQAGLPAPRPGKWFVYVLECEDGSLYKGHSQDILKRWKQHASGEGSEWTKKHPPKRLVHWEAFNSQEEAVAREKELKSGYGRKWLEREIKAGRTRQAGLPASVLLKKIAKEKERLIKEGKIKKNKPLPGISEDEKPFELPAGWDVVRFGKIINLISGQHLKPQEYSETKEPKMIPYLTGPAEFGEHYPETTRFTYMRRALASAGDILITCKGSGVGKLNSANTEIAISRQLMSIQPIIADPNYIKLLLQSMNESLRARIVGIAIPGISREDITEAIVKLPPLPEQHRIVAKVDELMAICDALKARLNEAQTTQVQLADAIVEQAVA